METITNILDEHFLLILFSIAGGGVIILSIGVLRKVWKEKRFRWKMIAEEIWG